MAETHINAYVTDIDDAKVEVSNALGKLYATVDAYKAKVESYVLE